MKDKRIADALVTCAIYAAVLIAGVVCLLPILNTLALSFSSNAQAATGTVYFLPKGATLAAYKTILREKQFFWAFLVSIRRVILGGALQFALTVLAAYPLSKSPRAFRGRNVYMWIFLFTMLFSGGLIPTYLLINDLGLLDSIWALLLPGAVPVYNVILLLNYFRSLSPALEEAAWIDGATPRVALQKIFLPLSLPSLATVTLFSIVGHWNSFFDAMIYMNDVNNYPLATYIHQLVNVEKNLSMITNTEELIRLSQISTKTVNSAKIFVAMLPLLAVYPFLQRYFVSGIVMGSVKE